MDEQPKTSPLNCSVARALSVIGERWTLLIVREAFDGVRRFNDFRTNLGIASNLLATRLDTLVAAQVMRRIPYREAGDRQRYEYELTGSGIALRPALVALLHWADEHLPTPDGPSVIVRHHTPTCEEPVRLVLECRAGHTHIDPQHIHRTPIPALSGDER